MKKNYYKIKIKLYKIGKVGWCWGQIYYKLYICDPGELVRGKPKIS